MTVVWNGTLYRADEYAHSLVGWSGYRQACAAASSVETWHGTKAGYERHKCRCARCGAAFRAYRRVYRARAIAAGQCVECSAPAEAGRTLCRRHQVKGRARQMAYSHRKASACG